MTDKDRETILIVSTEVEISTLLSDTLTGDGRFYAEQATSFYDALDKIVTGNFSLVLVDNKLPDMTGLDLLTATARLVPDLPIIVIDRELSARAALDIFSNRKLYRIQQFSGHWVSCRPDLFVTAAIVKFRQKYETCLTVIVMENPWHLPDLNEHEICRSCRVISS